MPRTITMESTVAAQDVTDLFAARTHHHRDFPVDTLVEAKAAQGLRVSVVVPARDEAATVGTVVTTLRNALLDEAGLVDELVVIDADSTDDTAAQARAAGARVVRQGAVLPDAGAQSGKGEALWKGLAATDGDLVVFVDADILDIDPRFVTGLLGPLLLDPAVMLSKATYDRPMQLGAARADSGGGRVTELLARPLIATFWPELSWLAQPLSGEYAGRRTVLEGVPFVCGYGVELALLVDIAAGWGPESIAQVDLGRRTHEHQPIDALGRMATEILHVALGRLAQQGRLTLTEPLGAVLSQPLRDDAGDLILAQHDIRPTQRPPLRDWRTRGGVDSSDPGTPDPLPLTSR